MSSASRALSARAAGKCGIAARPSLVSRPGRWGNGRHNRLLVTFWPHPARLRQRHVPRSRSVKRFHHFPSYIPRGTGHKNRFGFRVGKNLFFVVFFFFHYYQIDLYTF